MKNNDEKEKGLQRQQNDNFRVLKKRAREGELSARAVSS
jgi:hypothetical protein